MTGQQPGGISTRVIKQFLRPGIIAAVVLLLLISTTTILVLITRKNFIPLINIDNNGTVDSRRAFFKARIRTFS